MSCCQLQEFPDGVVFGAPLLRTLSLAGNTDVVLKPSDMRMLELPKRLQSLVSRCMLLEWLSVWRVSLLGSMSRPCVARSAHVHSPDAVRFHPVPCCMSMLRC